jgi:hypothetical protein
MDLCNCEPRRLLDNFTTNNIETPYITINQTCSLTEWGIFISSVILSSSAFITSVLSQIQKSKCKTISCLGTNCVRDINV